MKNIKHYLFPQLYLFLGSRNLVSDALESKSDHGSWALANFDRSLLFITLSFILLGLSLISNIALILYILLHLALTQHPLIKTYQDLQKYSLKNTHYPPTWKSMIIIKKEKDNKLYDSNLKKYVTLEDLLTYLKKGIEFKIISSTNKDITHQTLYALLYYKNHHLAHPTEDLIAFIKKGLKC